MANIYDQLDELQLQLQNDSLARIEEYYYRRCSEVAGPDIADAVKEIPLQSYEAKLKEGLKRGAASILKTEAQAIYFEYDMDNNWAGSFYLCKEYTPDDDDWACEWEDVIDGPQLADFGELIFRYGFDKNDISVAVTMYLITRTVCTFYKQAQMLKSERNIPIGIAYHGQDAIFLV